MRLKIPYKCVCMQDEGSFEMTPRGKGETIENFMQRLREAVSGDHMMRNPLCMSSKLEYLKVPMPKGSETKPLGSVE